MSRRKNLYEGKAKILYEGPEPGTLVQYFKDDATAFNNQKHATLEGKGVLNNRISEYIMVGLGRIGKRLGKAAHAIGMNVLATDLLPEAELRKAVDYPFTFTDHATLCEQSRIVTIHVDGRPENRRLIDAAYLSHLRQDALLINAARGMLVDHMALAEWARGHPDARVVLDVHDPEPPPADYPLWGLPNVTLLPHLASRTDTALENMSWVVRDVVRVLQGQPPQEPAF